MRIHVRKGLEPRVKLDEDEQIVFGEVYAPDVVDSQGDTMSAEEIKKMAYKFMEKMRVHKIDVQHNNKPSGAYVVESFIARDGDPLFIPGSWVLGVHIPDKGLWNRVKSGELNGFSFEGLVSSTPTRVKSNIPEEVKGLTDNRVGHSHAFKVKFDHEGNFLGGETDEVDGHKHVIKAGTVTEQSLGHTHRFSYVEGLEHVAA